MCGEDDEFTVICPICGEMIDAGAVSYTHLTLPTKA